LPQTLRQSGARIEVLGDLALEARRVIYAPNRVYRANSLIFSEALA